MNRAERRDMSKEMRRENDKWPLRLREIKREDWPRRLLLLPPSRQPVRAFRSREFFAQIYRDRGGFRISISRTMIKGGGDWQDGITWDDLQRLKREAGYGPSWAV